MDGIDLIAAERERQVTVEGHEPENDDEHIGGELADAAACYARTATLGAESFPWRAWPWPEDWWKPKSPIRDLVRAGALIAAEIDRRLRAGETE